MKILVTCPPMLGMMSELHHHFTAAGVEVHCPNVIQTLSEAELIELVPQFDGWIIGDDPATRAVFAAGKSGRLRSAVKWGIGVDNVDFDACREFGMPIRNTPCMFGSEVADLAMSYLVGLARETYVIHAGVKLGQWPKPLGVSLAHKTLGLVGFGDIGRNLAKRAIAADMNILAYDPSLSEAPDPLITPAAWPARIEECDFVAFTCALNAANRHMLNAEVLQIVKHGVRIVNVARGPLIDEAALAGALRAGRVHSAALDVFEHEPLPMVSPLRESNRCIFGSHNGSNTVDAVTRASELAIRILLDSLALPGKLEQVEA